MWQVEMNIGGRWSNDWSETFDTKEEAESELAEFLADQAEAFSEGNMDEVYDSDDYRVSEVVYEPN